MATRFAAYSFLPWMRRGIANEVTTLEGDPAVQLRAAVEVTIGIAASGGDAGAVSYRDDAGGLSVSKKVSLYGPSDIVGIDGQAIVKTEPREWITSFEPNYLPFIEFYDEDLPWRYTPAAPDDKGRLRPWLALIVLKEEKTEGQEWEQYKPGPPVPGRPLPYIECREAASLFPPADELWAWAHVQANRDLGANLGEVASSEMDKVLPRLEAVLAENPDLGYSRILCPCKLEENAAYHAFLMPTFETGRLAGLGIDPGKAPHATFSAWAPYPDGQNRDKGDFYPYYFRWYFRTGKVGDFEYLVRLLEPKPIDPRVGLRDMDVRAPGCNLRGIDDPALGGILKLGGALQIPEKARQEGAEKDEVEKYENWDRDFPVRFEQDLAEYLNLADDYSGASSRGANSATGLPEEILNDPDPLVTPPMYGRWHALAQRLLKDRAGREVSPNWNWFHRLNLDPRFRVAAGFGTRVVQANQGDYLNAAWEQVGQIREANRRIRQAQLAKEISGVWYDRHIKPLADRRPERALLLTAPLHKRVLAHGVTVQQGIKTSVVRTSVLSPEMRRALRPASRLMRSLPFDQDRPRDKLIDRINKGEVQPVRPKDEALGAASVDDVADLALPKDVPPLVVGILRRAPWLVYVLVLLCLILALSLALLRPSGGYWAAGVLVIAALAMLVRVLRAALGRIRRADSVREEFQTPATVESLPQSADFVLSEPQSNSHPTEGTEDSAEAARFKQALRDAYYLVEESRTRAHVAPGKALNVAELAGEVVSSIDPRATMARRLKSVLNVPSRVSVGIEEDFKEAMAYPVIDAPLYKPLADISAELFLPNINLVAQNSVSLLETNQRFIEAYMVGTNHEFARELLWQEYPTDQRGTYFRQFWDPSSCLDPEAEDPEAMRERLRDIPPLHRWRRRSKLGEHDNREISGAVEEEVVLVIRGELLKRYPTAVVYAHRARWQTDDGRIDNSKERRLEELVDEDGEVDDPPRSKVRTPLYQAKVEPEIYFFGFDLTVEEARGGTGEDPGDDPGWFFVIKERPGEPRFGLDIDRQGDLNTWGDLSWNDVLPDQPAGAHIHPGRPESIALTEVIDLEDEKYRQYCEDIAVQWNGAVTAAHLAYILYQSPVLVAMHASEMLPPAKS